MHAAYFETQFRCDSAIEPWPEAFILITGYATTGEIWSAEQNEAADRNLEEALRQRGCLLGRVTGVSPTDGHEEPGWAAKLSWQEGCDLGVTFKQDAIYCITGDELWVTYCDDQRQLIRVGSFRERILAEVSLE